MIKKSILCSFAFLLILCSSIVPFAISFSQNNEILVKNNETLVGLNFQDFVSNDYYFSGSYIPMGSSLYTGSVLRSSEFVPWRFSFGSTDWSISASFPVPGSSGYDVFVKDIPSSLVEADTWLDLTIDDDFGRSYRFGYFLDIGFNYDVRYFKYVCHSLYFGNTSLDSCMIYYYDSNDKVLIFAVAYAKDSLMFMPERIYFLTSSFNNNDYYQTGYQNGFSSGFSSGENTGYNKGFSAGNVVGYNRGFSAGADSAHEYTFLSLIGAVFDAPLNTFVSLLNFEVFGFNMLSAFTGLLTLAIIIFFVRIIMGRK